MNRATRWWTQGLQWFYPPACRQCGRALLGHDDPILCADCHRTFPWLGESVCGRCGMMAGAYADPVRGCRRCRRIRPAFTRATAPARYFGAARRLVLALKYGGDRVLAGAMAGAMAARAAEAKLPAADAVVPVPLHPSRKRARGYNQAEWLSAEVARRLGTAHAPAWLRRTRATTEQTRLRGEARRSFPAEAMEARGEAAGKTVLLVDDVMTTGATINACAMALRRAGAKRVYALAFAR